MIELVMNEWAAESWVECSASSVIKATEALAIPTGQSRRQQARARQERRGVREQRQLGLQGLVENTQVSLTLNQVQVWLISNPPLIHVE